MDKNFWEAKMKPWGCQIQEYVGTSFKIGLIRRFKKMLGLQVPPPYNMGLLLRGGLCNNKTQKKKKKKK
jgi:hypothetical protein